MLSDTRRVVRRRPAIAAALIALVVFSALTAAVSVAAPPGEPISQIEQDLVDAVNEEREKHGLQPYIVNYSLMEAAYNHNEHMANVGKLGHSGIGDGTPYQRIAATGYKAVTAGENVAQGYPNVKLVMEAWMNSSGHRANILHRTFTDIGVAHTSRGHYWTQVFALPEPPPGHVTVTPPAGHGRVCDLDGDLDFDGTVTNADVNAVSVRFMMTSDSPDWEARFDRVPDDVINVYDVFDIVLRLGDTCPR